MSVAARNKNVSAVMYCAFNNAVRDLLDDIVSSYPEEKNITAVKQYYELCAGMNVRMPYEMVSARVLEPYGGRIRARDERFFLEKELDDSGMPDGADILRSLKLLWSRLAEEDRQCMFDHFDCILSIHDSIVSGDAP